MTNVTQLYDAQLVDAPPQMPEGEYLATYIGHETAFIFTTPKVFVHFRIYEGTYAGKRIFAAYRVKAVKGKPRKGGAFKLGHSHKLYREMVVLNGSRERPDRVTLRALRGALLRVAVRTVRQDSNQKPLAPALQYSIVDKMLSVEAGRSI